MLFSCVITYSFQGQQVIQVHGLHRKCLSAACRATRFGHKIQTDGLSFQQRKSFMKFILAAPEYSEM
jgi:hypothetical protein